MYRFISFLMQTFLRSYCFNFFAFITSDIIIIPVAGLSIEATIKRGYFELKYLKLIQIKNCLETIQNHHIIG